jgi:hypothetical protein
MRSELQTFASLGSFPSEHEALPEIIAKHQTALHSISAPITDEEAKVLVSLFGPDDCFGLAWSILNLIETAPSWPILEILTDGGNEWIKTLRERAVAGGRM